MRVTVASDVDTIVMHDLSHRQRGGLWITDKGFQGWWGAVKPREEGVDIPQQDGCYTPALLTAGGRTVTVHGACVVGSSVHMAALRDRICDLACRRLTLTVEDAAGVRSSACWLADDPEPSMWAGEHVFEFTLVLYCPDPLKYGPEACFEGVSGLVVVENSGRVPTWPRIRVSGGVTSLSLVSGMGRVDWVGGADVLDLDFSDMMPSSGRVTVNRPFRVGPGAERLRCSMSGAGRMDLFVRPAWR